MSEAISAGTLALLLLAVSLLVAATLTVAASFFLPRP